MTSIHKRRNSKYWHAAFYLPDGRRALRSTKCTDKADAMRVALKCDEAGKLAREDKLTAAKALELISDIYQIAQREPLPQATVREHVREWLEVKALECRSVKEHRRAADDFLVFLGPRADKSVEAVTVRDVTAWRAKLAKELAPNTVNKLLKLMRGCFTRAKELGLSRENVFSRVDLVKKAGTERRALTLDELRMVLSVAGDEWRGIILAGLYTGQRLGDIAAITWSQIDLARESIIFTPSKTGKRRTIPIATPLLAWIMDRAGDDPRAPLFPTSSKLATATLSNQFTNLLADAGLIPRAKHRKNEERVAGSKRRTPNALVFHCLRHTATSLLKNAGCSDVIAREIIGHDSEAVSRAYTHIEHDSMRRAMEQMPDITKREEG